ncbi:AAA family ATPase [Psychrobacter sp. TB55-MNA-CIBAN-0194]|uniref:AAA family ATPase n=1 Tax=Psychrobacter sp. TB55-MNA-CIBAN-0194 TaxID=3140445 RepID=UPI00331B60AE
MKVKRLHLQNYGRFEDLKIDFAPTAEKAGNITVIVGDNGAGKSQILQALATGLSWFVNGVLDSSGQPTTRTKADNEFLKLPHEGEYIRQSQIKNTKEEVSLKLSFLDVKEEVKSIKVSATRKEVLSPAVYGIDDDGFNSLIEQYTNIFGDNREASLPLIANYTTDRNVEVNSINAGYSYMLNQLSAYKDFLNAGVNYALFFQWFRDNEDIENEQSKNKISKSEKVDELIQSQMRLHDLLLEREHFDDIEYFPNDEVRYLSLAELSAEIEKEKYHYNSLNIRNHWLNEAALKNQLTSLNAIRNAIEYFTNFKNPRIRRQGTPTMIVEKDGEELDVNQLSQGEKSLLALVGDIARRLAILNPSLDNPLEGEGMVMIDEVDLHLHPKWQHDLIDKFVKTFPNVQFVLTTHSPHVISDRPDTLVYALDDGELNQVSNVYGEDVNTVLTKVFDVPIRDPKAQKDFDKVAELIYQKKFESAESYIMKLEKQMPENLELLRCRLHLTQAQLAAKKEG